jgi:hypothetical protein
LAPEPVEDDEVIRRKALAEGVGFVLNSYLQSRSLLNPAGLAINAINQYEQQMSKAEREQLGKQEAEMRAMVSQIENLRATFEGGRLIVHLDKPTLLGLLERMLRRTLAREEAGMTAMFRIDLAAGGDADHEGEFMLPSRAIYLKFVPAGVPLAEFANSYLMRALSMNPSEYWLLVPTEDVIDFPFEPVFTENKIARGRLRTFGLAPLLGDIVGNDYDVRASYEPDGGFKFVISKKPPAPPISPTSG